MIDFNNPGISQVLNPKMLKAQNERLRASAWNDGYAARRFGRPRAAPPFVDPAMTEQWLDGYDCSAEINVRPVDQSIPADAVMC